MPHLVLEYSASIDCPPDLPVLFARLHEVLAETGGIRRDNCKSRARPADPFLVGSGSEADAFVHLDIRFLQGRSSAVKQALGQQLLNLPQKWFQHSSDRLRLQTTLEIQDIRRASYCKYPEGTLTPQ
jgi:5-carboxymethyl-2-hydroxymuconate isomerase